VYTSSSTTASDAFDFEGSTSLPANLTGTGYVTNNGTNAYSGTNYAGLNAATKYIRTNLISNPSSVSFYYRASGTSANYTVKCQTSTDGTTWSDVGTYVTTGSGASTTYVSENITLNLTGDYYIKWIMTDRSGGSFYFDAVTINKNIVNLTFVSGYENLTVAGTSQSVSGLDANTEYSYRVRATDASTTTANSNVITATTLPLSPTLAAATNITSDGFTSNWTAPVHGAADFTYEIQYSTVSDFSSGTVLLQNITKTFLNKDISLSSETDYYYRARCTNAGGDGAWSSIQSVGILGIEPTGNVNTFSATGLSVNSIKTEWSYSGNDADGWIIKAAVSPATPTAPVDGVEESNSLLVQNIDESANPLEWTFTGLDPTTTYNFEIFAYKGSGNKINYKTNQGQSASGTTLAPSTTAIAATDIVSRGFVAHWNTLASADAYIVELSTNSGFSSIDNLYENFGACITSNGLDISASLNSHTHYPGWTGNSVFEDFTFVRLNNGGHLQTPSIDLTENSGNHTLSFSAAYSGSASTLRVLLSTDGTNFSALGSDITLTSAFTTYTRSITSGTATSIIKFLVVSGDLYLDEVDISDFSETTTSTSLTYYGLSSNKTYYYRVRTVVNGVESENSNSITAATYTAPLTPSSNFGLTELNSTTFRITWSDGNGDGRLIKINNQNSFTQPTDFGTETTNTTWQNGGEQVVYLGDGVNTLDITLPGSSTLNITNFHMAIFEYTEHTIAKAVGNAYGIGTVYNKDEGWNSQLPIQLLSFEGAIMKDYNQIRWTTASEINNHFFTLQKSLDNCQFEDLARVEGAGNSNEIRNYIYNDFDQNFEGAVYYRLQQTDYDGSSTWSNVIPLNLTKSNVFRYWLGNNNQLNLSFNQASSNGQIELYSIDGKLIFSTSMNQNGPQEVEQIQLPETLHGIYLIKVIHDSEHSNGKLFIP
jgi:hypothetical protein